MHLFRKPSLFLLGIIVVLNSCEDKIDLSLDQGFQQVTVEAVLNTSTDTQTIILRGSVPFFDDINNTPAIDNGEVFVTSGTDTFPFVFKAKGQYQYLPISTKRFEVGKAYDLFIKVGNEVYTATSSPAKTAMWDSLTYEFLEKNSFAEEGYYLHLHARDHAGVGDAYWIRKYKNDTFASAPGDINTALDGGTSQGEFDGEPFIFPVSQGALNDFGNPLKINDKVRIEVQGISTDFYYFLDEIKTQMGNGGLFATPPSNVRTNISNANPNGRKGLGYFIIGEMVSGEVVIK